MKPKKPKPRLSSSSKSKIEELNILAHKNLIHKQRKYSIAFNSEKETQDNEESLVDAIFISSVFRLLCDPVKIKYRTMVNSQIINLLTDFKDAMYCGDDFAYGIKTLLTNGQLTLFDIFFDFPNFSWKKWNDFQVDTFNLANSGKFANRSQYPVSEILRLNPNFRSSLKRTKGANQGHDFISAEEEPMEKPTEMPAYCRHIYIENETSGINIYIYIYIYIVKVKYMAKTIMSYHCNVCIIGDTQSGKSSLVQNLISEDAARVRYKNHFIPHYISIPITFNTSLIEVGIII